MTRSICALIALLAATLSPLLFAQNPTDELIAAEQVREAVDSIMADYFGAPEDGASRVDLANESVARLLEIGPAAVPHLANELDRENIGTFDFAAYALGILGTDDATAALRNSLDRAGEATGSWPRARKAWAAWGLALAGVAEAVTLVNEGKHQSASYAIHGNTPVMEAAAIQTAPDCIPLLLEELKRDVADEKRWQERRAVLQAVGRVGDASLASTVAPLLASEHGVTRRVAAGTLGQLGNPESVDALLAALGDEELTVRRFAASALEEIAGPGREAAIAEWLDKLEDPHVRGSLYRWLVLTDRGQAFDILARHVGRPHPQDRIAVIRALGSIRHPRSDELLKEALNDRDASVVLSALPWVSRDGDAKGIESLARLLARANWALAQAVPASLVETRSTEAGKPIAERLLQTLAEPVTDAQIIVPAQKMAMALVALGYTDALDELREKALEQNDHRLQPTLATVIAQLELIEKQGSSVSRWSKTVQDPDPELRRLAYARLGWIGSAKATKTLVNAFDSAPSEDRIHIVGELGNVAGTAAHELLERVLLDPAFDAPKMRGLREMAGWSARRIGGDAMFDLLAAAVRRTQGREAKLTVYAALVGGDKALPLIRDYRRDRMRRVGWNLGDETRKLDWVARRLTRGFPIDSLDRPPGLMMLR